MNYLLHANECKMSTNMDKKYLNELKKVLDKVF